MEVQRGNVYSIYRLAAEHGNLHMEGRLDWAERRERSEVELLLSRCTVTLLASNTTALFSAVANQCPMLWAQVRGDVTTNLLA